MLRNGKKVYPVNLHLDKTVYGGLEEWAAAEGRSRRQQVNVLLRKVLALMDTHAADLQRLGIVEGRAAQ